MADGGQRLLDVIDDPNALESFLGGLTADAELLPSAETVDNVVASLARSLDDNEYEVDSPNETLFDTLDSSNHLTDISRSYVPSDFDHVGVQNDVFSNNLDGFSNGGGNGMRGSLPHHHEQQQNPGQNSGCDQFIGSSSNNNNNSTIINSVISASSVNTTNNTTVTGSTIKQLIAASVPNCDPSKSNSNYVQAGQLLTQNSVSSGSNNLSYVFSSHDLQKQIEVSHNQLNQVTSLSSVPHEGQQQLQQNVPSNSTNNLISVVGSGGHENGPGSTLTNSTSSGFQVVTNQQSGQGKAVQQNVAVSQNVSAASSVQVTSGVGAGASNTAISSGSNNVTLSTTTNVVGSNLASIQHQQQYIANTSTHQLMSGQTVSIPGMTVSAPQLIANSQGLVAASAGQNILQQIQSAGASQYITMDQSTALIATGGTTFGTNIALMATGGTPTYAVLPTTPQFLTNAIIPQPTIQTLTKAANGAYYQTTGTPQIVATSTVNALQNVGTAVTTSNTTTPPVTSVSSSTEANSGGAGSQQSLPTSSSSTTVTDGVMTQLIQQSQHQITNVTPQQSFSIGNAAGLGQVVVSQVGSLSTMTTPQQAHQLSGTIVVNQFGQPMLLPTASTAQSGLQLILRQQPAQPQVLTIQAPTAQGTAQATTGTSGKPVVRYVSQMPQLAQTSGYGLQQIQTANGPTWVAVRYPQASQASQFSQIQADSIINASSAIQNQIATSGQAHLQLQTQQSQQLQIQLQQQQAQQLIQQSQQQQLQFQAQQQAQQNQLQMQAQQQLSLQNQSQVHQLQNQQGQISSVQQQQIQSQSPHMNHLQQNQAPTPMETQSMSTPTQPNQFINRSNQTSVMHQSMNNSPQTQLSREVEQQQISVPDSSSEPPPPKKAKTKSKSSKKKVTLDLEQLLKQSGIMDEDFQDDMSFDFGFGSMMDTPPNGLPPSPQVPPPAQIPVINTTETPKKSKKKSNSKKSPAQAQPPPPPPVVLPPPPIVTPSPSAKKKRSPPKKKNAPLPPPTPPPPLPPPPPPTVTPTKSKSSKKKSSNSSGIVVNENQKSEPKTASSKKTAPPKKVSSLDTLLATIDAVAAAAGASYASSQSSPSYLPPPPPISSVPSQPTTPSRKPTPSPKSKSKSKSKSAKNSANTTPSSKAENLLPNSSTMTFPAPSTTLSQSMLPTFPQSQTSLPTAVVAPTPNTSTAAPPPSISPVIPTSRVTGANLTNGSTSVTTSQTGLTRVVQTIQLTPQNQQLLRNIQGEISRLYAIAKRNDSEQAALQKLHNLQNQIIATGTPVPNPTHLNNLAQIVNVEPISLATPSATVPSSDTASTSSSSAIAPLVFPCESDLIQSPVSSTVVATTAMSVLSNTTLINSSPKLISSKLSANCASSPVVATTTGATAGGGGSASSNGACIIVGSPSVSSTASPDSTSNLASNLNVEQCTVLPSTMTNSTTNNPTPSINSGGMGMGSVVVSNVKAELGQLVASLSVAPPEDKTKDNTQGKVTTSSTAVPVSTQSSVSFSQHLQHVPPPPSSYVPSTFSTRSVLDEKKAEEQRASNLKAEEEKRARWKKEEFEMLLQRDQQYVVKPDYEVPFESKKDAVGRLMKYHIYRDRNDMNFEEFDAEFGNNSGILLEKFSVMMSKYRNLLLKESTKEVGCAERVMLERMFVSEEKIRLEQDRMLVAQGDVMELPPPPESWVPKIKEMVDKEMIEFEPQDPVVSQQVQSAVDSIIGCGGNDTSSYLLEEGDKIEYDAFGVPINSSGYAGLAASSADIDEAVRSILT